MKLEYYKTFWLGEWRWRIKASNGKITASSSEGYKNRKDMISNLHSVREALNELHLEGALK